MGSKMNIVPYSCILVVMVVGFASSNINQDKEECLPQLTPIFPCLPFVGGNAETPTPDCCGGLKGIVNRNKTCLCILIKDRNDPNLGYKIVTSYIAQLPSFCHVAANISDCISLLHLPPNSTLAKDIEAFESLVFGKNHSTTSVNSNTSISSSGPQKSDGGQGKRWPGLEIVCGITELLIYYCFLHHMHHLDFNV
ncbi:LTP_2 domain-containing protein [Cephalotus follicularis]|uniref:LTP_2 domain-containing protein n=1 Tax=Cephalotus follicularis TaxID=3775 RepID=A0A1Q3D3R7_CEPFO|nr:LTP_2 domain-containing protein [Cephalotus follicularis]